MLLLWVVIAAVTVIVSILLSSVTVRRGCRQPLLALKAARPPLCLPLSGVGCLPKSFLGASSNCDWPMPNGRTSGRHSTRMAMP